MFPRFYLQKQEGWIYKTVAHRGRFIGHELRLLPSRPIFRRWV